MGTFRVSEPMGFRNESSDTYMRQMQREHCPLVSEVFPTKIAGPFGFLFGPTTLTEVPSAIPPILIGTRELETILAEYHISILPYHRFFLSSIEREIDFGHGHVDVRKTINFSLCMPIVSLGNRIVREDIRSREVIPHSLSGRSTRLEVLSEIFSYLNNIVGGEDVHLLVNTNGFVCESNPLMVEDFIADLQKTKETLSRFYRQPHRIAPD